MKQLITVADCRQFRKDHVTQTIALVPTMGALHEGHLSLVKLAKAHADMVIVSIFVNPLQFGAGEDFDRYPRTLEADLKACEVAEVDAVFAPPVSEMYPTGQMITEVVPQKAVTEQFCGLSRPGHFTGVATVVMKLFTMTGADLAVFGEKDAQQFAVLRHMVGDLNLPITLLEHPIVREADGLAKSSRNQYLTDPVDRLLAAQLYQLLQAAQSEFKQGEVNASSMVKNAIAKVIQQEPLLETAMASGQFQLDYFSAVDADTFLEQDVVTENSRFLIAAKVGVVRLIDNLKISV